MSNKNTNPVKKVEKLKQKLIALKKLDHYLDVQKSNYEDDKKIKNIENILENIDN